MKREDKAGLRGRARVCSTRRWSKAWAQYLEGRLRNETVKIAHRGRDIHRYSPLFLRGRLGRLQGGCDRGCFLEKSVGVIKV